MIRYESGDISYSYTYDAECVRRSKQNDNVQGSKITYISDTLCEYSQTLAELNSSDELCTSYTIGLEIISLTRGEEEYYYISDGHGDVRIITDEDGHVKTKYRYNGYGELIETSGDIENSHMYTGECYDEESGLYYLRARYMNPSTGTFTGMDSYAGNISDPDTLHKYLYANGNPVKYVDPSGNMATIGEGSFALGISNILDNAGTIFVMGILNGLLSVGITAVFGDNQEDNVIKSFWSGFAKGAAFIALDFFVSGLFLINILKVFLCDAGAHLTVDFLLSWYYTFKGDNGKTIEYRIYSLIDLLIFGLLYNANLKTNKTKAVDLQGKAKIKASDYDPIEGGSGTDTPINKGYSRPNQVGEPNSIYEQLNPDGTVKSRTFFDENGREFSRQDFDHPHFDKNTQQYYQPHEHNYTYNSNGQRNGKTVIPLPDGYSNLPTED